MTLSKLVEAASAGVCGKAAGSLTFSSIQDVLADYSQSAPNRNAVLAPGRSPVTYRELWAWTNEAIGQLRSLNIGPDDRVAVVLPNGPDAAIAMLAVAAGAVCVPLNPGYSAREWQHCLGDLQVAALLTSAGTSPACRETADSLKMPVVELVTSTNGGLARLDHVNPAIQPIASDRGQPSSDDAFILLTSGTSSKPKGVPLAHAAVCRSAYNVGATIGLMPEDRLLNVLPLFHVHGLVSGLLASLVAGSSVVCTTGFDAGNFFTWLKEFAPTWYTAVPAIHQAVLTAAPAEFTAEHPFSLRIIRSASSTLPPSVTDGLEALFGIPVINTYGMTEAASQIAANPVERRKPGSVGLPAGSEIEIMDAEGRPLPLGQRGEIALRGPTITRGYVNDTEATKAAFHDNWFRTGDLGYLDDEGYLFIVGRIKDIINRGGQKIAPPEVEEVLLSHAGVAEAAVFSISHPRLGEDVAAAVVPRAGTKLTFQELRSFAAERLAMYKVPGLIRIVPQIPKGPAGKIKRSELASALSLALHPRTEGDGKATPPRSELEWQLANIFQEILELAHVSVDDDILAIGADSIAIMRILSRVRTQFGLELSFRQVFDTPTISSLAARIESLLQDPVDISSSACGAPSANSYAAGRISHPPSIVQEGALRLSPELLTLEQFNRVLAYRLRGALNVSALKQSLGEVVRRHDSLRTGFGCEDGSPVALIDSVVDIDALFLEDNLSGAAHDTDDRIEALILQGARLKAEQESLRPFELRQAPLLRACLLRLGADDHVLLLVLHEMIADAWSVGVFLDELSDMYALLCAGEKAQLPSPPLQFYDFARWQRDWLTSSVANQQLTYWSKRLDGIAPVFDAHEESAGAPFEANIAEAPVHLSSGLLGRLHLLSHRHGTTLFMTLLAGFKALLLARSGRNDICVATPMANRSHPLTERLIGPLANTTLICTRVDADLSFDETLRRVRLSVIEAFANQQVPFDILAKRLSEECGLDPTSLVQVLFVFQNAVRKPLPLTGIEVQPFAVGESRPIIAVNRTALSITLAEAESGIAGTCRYRGDRFEPNNIQDWLTHYNAILTKAAADPKMSLGRLAERQP